MMKLYAHPLSLFSAKVRIVLAEKAVQYQLENVALDPVRGYHPKHPKVVAHNPKRQVPVLVVDDFALYDSTLILEFLEDLAPDPPLYPREAKARARCRLLELEADELFFVPIRTLIQRRYAKLAGAPDDPAERSQVEVEFASYCQRLSGHLGDSEFLCDQFSVADLGHFLVALFAQGFGLRLPEQLSNLQGWFQRLASRPAIAGDLASMLEAKHRLDALAVQAATGTA